MEAMLNRQLQQTAVYWASPTSDGYGTMTYDDPVEIKCRWQNKMRVIQTGNGEAIVCQSEVWVLEDLDEQGMLYLGELDDLDSNELPPDSASEIKIIEKTPAMGSTTVFLRKVFL